MATFLFWRSAYISTLFSLRNRVLVATDWIKVKLFGRCVDHSFALDLTILTDVKNIVT
jgi:hypothetical protein